MIAQWASRVGERFTTGEVGGPWRRHLYPWMGCKAITPTSLLHSLVLFVCLFVYSFTYLYLASLVFVAVCELSLVAVLWILTAMASVAAEHRSRACGLRELWRSGLAAPRHVESFWTSNGTHVLSIGRWILNHWTTREVHLLLKLLTENSFPYRRCNTTDSNFCCCCCSVAKSCLTLCDPMDCSPPCSSVHGILQARILEWVAFSRGSSPLRNQTCISCLAGRFFTTDPQITNPSVNGLDGFSTKKNNSLAVSIWVNHLKNRWHLGTFQPYRKGVKSKDNVQPDIFLLVPMNWAEGKTNWKCCRHWILCGQT